MKLPLVLATSFFLQMASASTLYIERLNEIPTKGDIFKVARDVNREVSKIKTKDQAEKAIDLMLQLTVPPEFEQELSASKLSPQDQKKIAQRLNRNISERYHTVKNIIELSIKFKIKSNFVLSGLEKIAKYDYVTRTRRLAMIGLLSLYEYEMLREDFLRKISLSDGELIFDGEAKSDGQVKYASFDRGRTESEKRDIFKYDDINIKESILNIKAERGESTLDLPILDTKIHQGLVVVENSLDKLYKKRVSDIDSTLERLRSDASFNDQFIDSDLHILTNPAEDFNFGNEKRYYVKNNVTLSLTKEERDSIVEEIREEQKPLWTIQNLENIRKYIKRSYYESKKSLANGVTVSLRDNTVIWAKNLLERNEKGEAFNFHEIYSNAVRGECEDKTKFECSMDLLK